MVGAQVGSQYEQRAAVAAQRVRELDERRRELAASVTEADDAGRPERLRRRQSAAEAASRHAAEADWMARVACGRVADRTNGQPRPTNEQLIEVLATWPRTA